MLLVDFAIYSKAFKRSVQLWVERSPRPKMPNHGQNHNDTGVLILSVSNVIGMGGISLYPPRGRSSREVKNRGPDVDLEGWRAFIAPLQVPQLPLRGHVPPVLGILNLCSCSIISVLGPPFCNGPLLIPLYCFMFGTSMDSMLKLLYSVPLIDPISDASNGCQNFSTLIDPMMPVLLVPILMTPFWMPVVVVAFWIPFMIPFWTPLMMPLRCQYWLSKLR